MPDQNRGDRLPPNHPVNASHIPRKALSSEYDLRLLGDSVVAYLPYFGRAYAATYGSGDGGIKFTSTQFEYTAKTRKKGWDITIAPKDGSDVRQLFLSVSPNG